MPDSLIFTSGIRGWLAWRHYNAIDKKERQLNEDTRDVKNIEKKVFFPLMIATSADYDTPILNPVSVNLPFKITNFIIPKGN